MSRNLHAALYTHMEAIWEPRSTTPTFPRTPRARRKCSQVPGQRENVSLTQARKGCRRVLLDPLVSALSRERVRSAAWQPIVGGPRRDVLADGPSRSAFPMVEEGAATAPRDSQHHA